MTAIEYEGTDITTLVTVSRCVYDAREEGRVPQLVIAFDDERSLWDSWAPQPGERISVKSEGASPTGTMYVKACTPVAGGYEIRADALPISDAKALRTWRSTTLRVAIEQLAETLGLSVKFHGCDDMLFAYIRQDGEGALPVMARICALAGCTFDVYDGVAHVCGRDWVASQESTALLEITGASRFEYTRKGVLSACILNQSAIAGVRPGLSATVGSGGRTMAVVLDERIGLPSSYELERACAGVLACENARRCGGSVKSDSLSPFSPGAVCAVTCSKAPSLSGKGIITRVRNDFGKSKSKTWWRQLA